MAEPIGRPAKAPGECTTEQATILHFSLAMPGFLHGVADRQLRAARVPAAFAGAVLLALCAVPCSGAVYLGVLALVSATTTAWRGVAYLADYNLMSVLPLVLVLAAAANRRSFNRVAHFRNAHKETIYALMGAMMVGRGPPTLVFLG